MAKNNTSYEIVKGSSKIYLEEKVNEKLDGGYKLQGGVAVDAGNDVFLQAMVFVTPEQPTIGKTGPK